MVMEWAFDPQIWLGLVTLSVLEVVLGIDNLVFLSILTDRLPEAERRVGARLGLLFALVTRLGLLGGITWLVGLVEPVVTIFGQPLSWRDMILVAGGVFLLAKGTHEIHGALEGDEDEPATEAASASSGSHLLWVAVQIGVLDLVFSLDSVVTAVGMSNHLGVMAAAVVIAMAVMVAAAPILTDFLSRRPTVRMLALAFLLLIGMSLVADGLGVHIPKGYLYFAMGFAVVIEALNLLARHRQKPVKLRHPLP
jgi:predicted tellurium resistance membrane protein TerC